MRAAPVVLLLALVAGAARAQTAAVERVYLKHGSASALVSVVNTAEPRGYALIGLECTFTLRGRPVGRAGGVIVNLPYGRRGTAEPGTTLGAGEFDGAECRVEYAYPNP